MENNILKKTGEKLRKARRKLQIPQWQIAQSMGLSQATISKIENGKIDSFRLIHRYTCVLMYYAEVLHEEIYL